MCAARSSSSPPSSGGACSSSSGWGRRSRRSSSASWPASRPPMRPTHEGVADLQERDAAVLHVADRLCGRGDLCAHRGLLLLQHLRLLHARVHARAHAPLPWDRRRLRTARVGTGGDGLPRAPPHGRHVHRGGPLRLGADREPDRRLDHDVRHSLDALDHRVERGLRGRRVGQGAPAPLDPRAQRQLRQGRARHEGRRVLPELHRPRALPHAPRSRSAPVEGMIRKILDWGGYVGLAALVVAAALKFQYLPGWAHYWGFFLLAGVLLVAAWLLSPIEDYRARLGRRATRYGLNAAVMILLVLGVTGLVQALAVQHTWRYDLTENKRFSLSPQTIQVAGSL